MKPRYPLHLSILCLAMTSCSPEQPAVTPPVRPVYTFTVEKPAETFSRVFSGTAQAAEGTDLSFEVGGRVVSVLARVGEEYAAEALLAQLDDTEYLNQLQSAEAVFDQASEEMKRSRLLFEQGNTSKSKFDAALAQFRSAQANQESARKRVDDCALRMPYTGRIGQVMAEAQEVVSPGQTVLSIQGEGSMEMIIGVPAQLIRSFSMGLAGAVTFSARPHQTYTGTVTEVSPQIGDNTTYPVTMTLTPDDQGLVDGMDGEALFHFTKSGGHLVSIPASSVVGAPGDTTFVWVVALDSEKAGTVQRQAVTPGELIHQGRIEIESGLEPGQLVVTRGVHRLEEGTRVSLLER